MISRQALPQTKRWVVKIGSAMLTNDGQGLALDRLAAWVDQLADLAADGREIVIVSSGAVAEGMTRLKLPKRPTALHELQAAAAVGQMGLVQAWESAFQQRDLHTAQILLTHDDLSDRKRYLNARSTILTLIGCEVVPIINENDAVANEELRFGDNDTLAAQVANLIEADLLVLLTDQAGLFDADPRTNPQAKLISEAKVNEARLDQVAGGSAGGLGRGGMFTKLRASRLAARSGAATVIASGGEERVLQRLACGELLGTLLLPTQEPQAARKRWLAGQLQARGALVLDDGAVQVLRESGKSLLSVGVVEVHGAFERGEMVLCLDRQGCEVARGLSNFKSTEADQIKGLPSNQIEAILGYIDDEELIHRDNLVLV